MHFLAKKGNEARFWNSRYCPKLLKVCKRKGKRRGKKKNIKRRSSYTISKPPLLFPNLVHHCRDIHVDPCVRNNRVIKPLDQFQEQHYTPANNFFAVSTYFYQQKVCLIYCVIYTNYKWRTWFALSQNFNKGDRQS